MPSPASLAAMHPQKVARGKMLFFISKFHPLSALTPHSFCSTHFLDLIMGAGRVHTFSCYPGELLTQTFKKVEHHRVLQKEDGNHIEVQVPQTAVSHSQLP